MSLFSELFHSTSSEIKRLNSQENYIIFEIGSQLAISLNLHFHINLENKVDFDGPLCF